MEVTDEARKWARQLLYSLDKTEGGVELLASALQYAADNASIKPKPESIP